MSPLYVSLSLSVYHCVYHYESGRERPDPAAPSSNGRLPSAERFGPRSRGINRVAPETGRGPGVTRRASDGDGDTHECEARPHDSSAARRIARKRARSPSHARVRDEQRCARGAPLPCDRRKLRARERDTERDGPPRSQRRGTIPDRDGDDKTATRRTIYGGRDTHVYQPRESNKTADVLPCVSDLTVAHARSALSLASASLARRTPHGLKTTLDGQARPGFLGKRGRPAPSPWPRWLFTGHDRFKSMALTRGWTRSHRGDRELTGAALTASETAIRPGRRTRFGAAKSRLGCWLRYPRNSA